MLSLLLPTDAAESKSNTVSDDWVHVLRALPIYPNLMDTIAKEARELGISPEISSTLRAIFNNFADTQGYSVDLNDEHSKRHAGVRAPVFRGVDGSWEVMVRVNLENLSIHTSVSLNNRMTIIRCNGNATVCVVDRLPRSNSDEQ